MASGDEAGRGPARDLSAGERSAASSRAADCLAGGGAMGALMRAFDWSRTPVGPVERWPQSLRTAVSIMLESRFGMYIAWGREYTQFYNDGYRPILGSTKHPAIGKSTADTFRESWHIIGPLFEQVMGGEAVGSEDWMLPLDRHGYLEECFFTFSYSPIRDESGGVGGVHVTVTETTRRVLGERRLRILRELAAVASDSATVEDVWTRAAAALGGNTLDLPFFALYALDAGGQTARRVGAGGLPAAVSPEELPLRGGLWPLDQAAQARAAVTLHDVTDRIGELQGPCWPEVVRTAVVLPVTRPSLSEPYGFLLAGISPRRALDEEYHGFLELACEHIAAALADARAYEEERRRAEALAELDRAKTVFFSNVSHEFRTPLTLMLGPLADLLAGGEGPLEEAQSAQVRTVHRNALRLLKLVNTLLDFARIEAGRARAVFEPVDLSDLTRDLAGMFRAAVERAGLELEVDCPPLPHPVHVDRDMWEKIVLNLLSNAFKFTFEGKIAVSLRWKGEEVELEVRDTGAGIPAQELPNLFKRFHRVTGARARSHEGSGIGLALVQELARLHGGTVSVESEPGAGSSFRVSVRTGTAHLPSVPVEAREQAPTGIGATAFVEEALRWLPGTESEAPGSEGPQAGQAARILVADDNADMRAYLRRLLGAHWIVEAVGDGAAALEAARRSPPDLVLADVMMPGLDGFALLRALRADERTRAIPVVMLSARAGEEASVEGLDAGADDYLVKPFGARELLARVRSQLALVAARRAVVDHRNALYELFMQAPAPICVVRGEDIVFEMANASYVRLVSREVVGKRLFDALPELQGQGFDGLIREVMRTGQPCYGHDVPVRYSPRGDGTLEDTYFTFVYAPLLLGAGPVDRVMVFCFEVTDQVRARQELEAARQRSDDASRAKDEFLAMLGHELRNPLAPISTALELMKLRGGDGLLKERTIIERQVKHLVTLVDDLLDVARVARGKVQLRRRRVDLAEVVARAIEMSSPLLEERRHTLATQVRPALIVEGDEQRLTQVVANLLTNAAKYTDPGGRIRLSASHQDGHVVLKVSDNGMGLSPELASRVFDLFVQGSRPQGGQGGLGLGLTLVRSLVELHDGSVAVHSDGRGRGSEFTVRLPALDERRSLRALPAPPAVRARRTAAGWRVLVVDDNRDAAETLADTLAELGYEVQAVFDGLGALDVADSFRPHAALIDLAMPVMDGYELARRLRERPGGDDLRLLAVTGYGQERDRARSQESGFDAHLVKPLELEALVGSLHDLLPDAARPAGGA